MNGANNGDAARPARRSSTRACYEINDFQHLAGQIADDAFFNVNPERVVGDRRLLRRRLLVDGAHRPDLAEPGRRDMTLAAVAPKYGWTDLVVLARSDRASTSTRPNALPAFDGSDSSTPLGIPKKSILTALCGSGTGGVPPPNRTRRSRPRSTRPSPACNRPTPIETNPLCTAPIANTLPSFINDRSAYYQNAWFTRIATDPSARIPIFNAATFTDPLFTPVENLRMYNRIKQVVPNYPIQQYFGDYQHFVQNKAKEWGDLCGAEPPRLPVLRLPRRERECDADRPRADRAPRRA